MKPKQYIITESLLQVIKENIDVDSLEDDFDENEYYWPLITCQDCLMSEEYTSGWVECTLNNALMESDNYCKNGEAK